MTLGLTTKRESLGSSFPHAFSGNPDFFKSLDPRQKHARVTGRELSYKHPYSTFRSEAETSAAAGRVRPRCASSCRNMLLTPSTRRAIRGHLPKSISCHLASGRSVIPIGVEYRGWRGQWSGAPPKALSRNSVATAGRKIGSRCLPSGLQPKHLQPSSAQGASQNDPPRPRRQEIRVL
jgi:hypothetical protein